MWVESFILSDSTAPDEKNIIVAIKAYFHTLNIKSCLHVVRYLGDMLLPNHCEMSFKKALRPMFLFLSVQLFSIVLVNVSVFDVKLG